MLSSDFAHTETLEGRIRSTQKLYGVPHHQLQDETEVSSQQLNLQLSLSSISPQSCVKDRWLCSWYPDIVTGSSFVTADLGEEQKLGVLQPRPPGIGGTIWSEELPSKYQYVILEKFFVQAGRKVHEQGQILQANTSFQLPNDVMVPAINLEFFLSPAPFLEAFESLLRFAENRTSSLFETAYRPMAKEAAEPVKELFTDISLYILGAETTVESAVLRFFDSLFPLVYSRLINPGITDLSEDYTECLRLTRQDINPFGHYSKNMVTELSKSLWASRMLSQALSLGIEVINTTEHAAVSKECSRALVKMQYCPHCQGLTLIRPCVGYCLNVMRGCLASVAELDAHWRQFISTLEYLANEMAASHELEMALSGMWSSINEAILHAQLNGPQLSATVSALGLPVDKVCGQPRQQEGNLSSANIVPVKEVTETQTFVMAHSSLNNKRREFINYMKRSRTFYASVAERLCDGDLVMRDSSTCWNGEDVVERIHQIVQGELVGSVPVKVLQKFLFVKTEMFHGITLAFVMFLFEVDFMKDMKGKAVVTLSVCNFPRAGDTLKSFKFERDGKLGKVAGKRLSKIPHYWLPFRGGAACSATAAHTISSLLAHSAPFSTCFIGWACHSCPHVGHKPVLVVPEDAFLCSFCSARALNISSSKQL
ncbi:hypothetical protein IHE44_0001771 [Lamprotornis superbus]|uniref:Glypican 5 n=1 Tax=Lamprotornis superbus TaxID=245042 RepID=A0A835NMR8_9PASS|nr:hypothetical protein IHE44_0001771 [Lamprotornis superbus]